MFSTALNVKLLFKSRPRSPLIKAGRSRFNRGSSTRDGLLQISAGGYTCTDGLQIVLHPEIILLRQVIENVFEFKQRIDGYTDCIFFNKIANGRLLWCD